MNPPGRAKGESRSAPHEGAPMNPPEKDSARVLAVMDDAAAGEVVLGLSSKLARVMRRDLSVIYVESSRSLGAAALPFTQVLSHAGSPWVPLETGDIEQGFRVQAARLRELAAQVALRDEVHWSLRVMRGTLARASEQLLGESNLLLLAAATPAWGPVFQAAAPPSHRPPRPTVVALAGDGDEATQRAMEVATLLANALAGTLEVARGQAAMRLLAQAQDAGSTCRPAVLVVPREMMAPDTLARMRCPVLLVG